MEQETTNVAAVAILARSPDPAVGLEYGRDLDIAPLRSQQHLFAGTGKASLSAHQGAPRMKETNHKRSLTTATEFPKALKEKITEAGDNDSVDDLADIFISDEVLKQLRSHTDNKDKKSSKQRRKIARLQSKTVRLNAVNNKEEIDVIAKDSAKKMLKPSLRSKGSLATSKSQVIERTGSMDFRGNSRRGVRNKAANNNWMASDGISTDAKSLLTPRSMFGRNPASYVDNIIRASDSACKVCCVRNCTPQSCREVQVIMDPATKEYSFKRADSSDDSGCFSNQSLQSISSPRLQNHDTNTDSFPVSEESAVENNYTPVNENIGSHNTGLCSACGNEPQGHGSGLCKTCIGRIKHDGIRIGALGELRAYAQSIADSVKKILSINPRGDEEVMQQLHTKEGREGHRKGMSKRERETTSVANIPTGCLQKCKTQIAMTVGEELRPKSLLNKSISFDGRVAAVVEDKKRGSPVYWITQEKPKLPLPASTFCESIEDKILVCSANASDHSVLEGDYFSPDAKELKPYTGLDDDKNSKTDKVDKQNKRHYTKQVSCVDRIRTDGTIRRNSFQQGGQDKKQESKKVYEIQRSRSRILRSANMDLDIYDKPHQKREEEMKALNVFRLKVIHEGSPVDPLYTVQKVKGGDEGGKDRRTVLLRSATAPNKNHVPKKDNTAEDKTSMMRNVIMAKRSSTKLGIKPMISHMFVNECSNIENEEEPKQIAYEPPPESWRDDVSIIAVTPFARRRSTSYDGNQPVLSKRSDLHKSISRSAIDREANRNKQRKQTPSMNRTSTQNKPGNDNGFSWQPSRFSVCWAEEATPNVVLPGAVSLNRSPVTKSDRYHNTEALDNEFSAIDCAGRVVIASRVEDITELSESTSQSAYFDDVNYYQRPTEAKISSVPKELPYIEDRNIFDADHYYNDAVEIPIDDGIEADKVSSYSDADVDDMFKGDVGEDAYHSRTEQYNVNDVSPVKESLWYDSHLDRRILMARDGSHESKSSTCFQIVINARSSHSDVSLMRYQGAWEHPNSRRQSMYSETDVDTGLIYHFAKRQTTRAHVPAYHDLTSASKDIYTMSGDVSTSASSNSSISTKSDVSDCVYTGGFFKHDPFYDNDSKVSISSSSADSSGQLYFEPNNGTKREPSELDLYTGAIFSSSQNALSLGTSRQTKSPHEPNEALQDGSTNNSTRPVAGRMSRRHRYRPRIDVIKFKSTSVTGFLSKCMEPNKDVILCNISNNSCTWCNMDEPEEPAQHGAVVRISANPMYTDYADGMKPVFHTRKVEKSKPVVDLLKYERQDTPSSNCFFTTPSDDISSDSNWYSGFSKHKKMETVSKHPAVRAQSYVQCAYRWQYDDDYYTSSQRPRLDQSNNNSPDPVEVDGDTNNNKLDQVEVDGDTNNNKVGPVEVAVDTNNNIGPVEVDGDTNNNIGPVEVDGDTNNNKLGPVEAAGDTNNNIGPVAVAVDTNNNIGPVAVAGDTNNNIGPVAVAGDTNNNIGPVAVAGDTNNNRLDDIYTGFFESPKALSSPEQQHRSRRTSSDSWYADHPRRSYSYRDHQTQPDPAGRAFASDYDSTEGAYSSPSVFAQAREAYAGSSYMSGSGWKEYDRGHSPASSNYADDDDDDESPRPRPLIPGGYSSGDKYSYFPYNSNLNPADCGYLYDQEPYAFDQRQPSPEVSGDNKIRKVGGIVCRENVVNKEDYAEDVNRDLEQGVWTPYNFRHDEKPRHSDEPSSSRSEPVPESHKAAPVSGGDKHSKHFDDSIYNQNRLYDSGGDRKKWRESSSFKKSVPAIRKTPSPHRATNSGDAKKVDYKLTAWNPPDQIPDKARGKRNMSSTPKTASSEGSRSGSTTSHVISSVTSLPSRLTNYVKKWL